MNAFFLDLDPAQNARFHVDSHVTKIILEAAQVLCTAAYQLGVDPDEIPYKPTHKNHPLVKWCAKSRSSNQTLVAYATALHDEKQYRYGGTHASMDAVEWAHDSRTHWPSTAMRPIPHCLPDYLDHDDLVVAYRTYYALEKGHLFEWTDRPKPAWIDSIRDDAHRFVDPDAADAPDWVQALGVADDMAGEHPLAD